MTLFKISTGTGYFAPGPNSSYMRVKLLGPKVECEVMGIHEFNREQRDFGEGEGKG